MSDFLNSFLFGYFPYIAFTVFLVGSFVRYNYDQYTWRSGSSQLLRRKQLVWGSNLFHVGILIIFFGHFAGLLTPIAFFDWVGIPHGAKQIIAMVVGGIAGVICFIGMVLLIHRRFFDPRIRNTSSFSDKAILLLIFAQLVLGLATIAVSYTHMDGEEMLKFMNWAQGIVTFNPGAAAYISDVHPLFKAHITLGLSLFLFFPFTRLVHILSAPIWYLVRTGYQIVRTKKRA